jgi:hypothetical protein
VQSHPVDARYRTPTMDGRAKVRRRVLACARCRKRKLSVEYSHATKPFIY